MEYIFSETFRNGDNFETAYFKMISPYKVQRISESEYKAIQEKNRKPFIDYINSKKCGA